MTHDLWDTGAGVAEVMVSNPVQAWIFSSLIFTTTVNLTNRKTLQSHKLNYFIKQWVIFLMIEERLLKAVQYLSLINLIKPTTVNILAHH